MDGFFVVLVFGIFGENYVIKKGFYLVIVYRIILVSI